MDFSTALRQAWQMTWRYRFLWILGLFVPGAAGTWSFGGSNRWSADGGNRRVIDELPPEMSAAATGAATWIGNNWGVVAMVVGLALVVGLVMFVVSLIAQGGMVQATAALARGEPMTLGVAWRWGLALGWRYFGLGLILAAIVILAGVISGGLAVLTLAAAGAGGEARGPLIALAVLLGLLMLVIFVPLAIAMTIVTTFAQRSIALEDVGPIEGLRRGWRLMWSHKGSSALAWLINVGLGLVAGLAVGLSVVVLLAALGGVGFGLYALWGWSTPLFAYGGLALLTVIAGSWLLSAIANTFFWSYWTLIYLQLTPPPAVSLERAA